MTAQDATESSSTNQHFIFREGLQGTYAFLKSYQGLGSLARTFMLREHAAMLQKLHQGSDQFSNCTQQQKDHFEILIYVELLERLCLLIEDLAKLLHALQFDLKLFLEQILSKENPQNILRAIDTSKWNTILRYAQLDTLAISTDDQLFLSKIRQKNIERLNIFVDLCLDFLELHWPFFIRHKHGNTILYGLGSATINGLRSFMIPAVFNQRHPERIKGILVNGLIFQKWQTFFDGLVLLTQWLVERTIVFIETGGKAFAEYGTYFVLHPEEKSQLEQIVKRCDEGTARANITVTIEASIESQGLKKFSDFYAKFDRCLIKK